MHGMAPVKKATLEHTATFQLGTIGAVVAQRFAEKIEPLGLKPKHVGLLTLLAANPASSQLDMATAMNVAPSLVVRIADQLESLGAIERTRDPDDRRRQTLRLTERGRALFAECASITRDLEADLLAGLQIAERKALIAALRHVAGNLGLAF
jgi:DNA-binding MarR family transcriptional regulator